MEDKRIKALDAYVAYLTLKHSEDQEAIASNLALNLYPLWAIQRFTELDRSTPLWVSATLPQVKTAFLQSQRVAAVYAQSVQYASLPLEEPLLLDLPHVELPQGVPSGRFSLPRNPLAKPSNQSVMKFEDFRLSDVATSLMIQGNYEIKAQMPGPEEDLMYNGLKNSSGAAIRQAMNGGRGAVNDIVRKDRRAIGYARFTDSNPCYFCALLASKGTVYKIGSFKASDAKFKDNENAPDLPEGYSDVAKVHDHCRCSLRPVFRKSQEYDADAKFYRKRWDTLVRNNPGASNDELLKLWRKHHTPFERTPPPIADLREALEQRQSAISEALGPNSPQAEWTTTQLNLLAV